MSVNRKAIVARGRLGARPCAGAAGCSVRSGGPGDLAQPRRDDAEDRERQPGSSRSTRSKSHDASARQVVGSSATTCALRGTAVEHRQLAEELARAEVGDDRAVTHDAHPAARRR